MEHDRGGGADALRDSSSRSITLASNLLRDLQHNQRHHSEFDPLTSPHLVTVNGDILSQVQELLSVTCLSCVPVSCDEVHS